MVLVTRWQLVSVQNAEAYHKKINTPPEFLARLKALHAEIQTNPSVYEEEITIDKPAGKIHRVVFIRGEKKRDSGLVNLNEDFEHDTADGRNIKGRVTIEGDNKLVFKEKGPDFEATVTLEMNGDNLTATLQSGDVVCVEKFRKV